MALPSWSLRMVSIRGDLGLETVLATPHDIRSAKGFRTGFALARSALPISDFVGGSCVPSVLYVQVARLSGCDRNSIHSHAASETFVWSNITSESPARVVLHPATPLGGGAAAHLPSSLGYSSASVPANQAPAMYIATSPLANAVRPS